MGWLVQPLLFFLACCTRNQLIRNIEFLKLENEILCKRLVRHHIVVNAEDRARLMQIGEAIGPDLKRLITIVGYGTYQRWVRRAKHMVPNRKPGTSQKARGDSSVSNEDRARDGWGYTRILGELRKLGIMEISRQTVVNILKENDHDPYSRKGPGSWDDLIKRHAVAV